MSVIETLEKLAFGYSLLGYYIFISYSKYVLNMKKKAVASGKNMRKMRIFYLTPILCMPLAFPITTVEPTQHFLTSAQNSRPKKCRYYFNSKVATKIISQKLIADTAYFLNFNKTHSFSNLTYIKFGIPIISQYLSV